RRRGVRRRGRRPGPGPRRRRAQPDRGVDVPARRALPRRPRQVPPGRRGPRLAGPRPGVRLPGPADPARDRRGAAGRDRAAGPARRRRGHRRGRGRSRARRRVGADPGMGGRRIVMAELTYRAAVAHAIAQEMRRDDRVVFLGEDVGAPGGVFNATPGLLEEFGPRRVRDTPISEQAIVGAAMGAAMTGLRPIAEIMFSDFLAACWDSIATEIAQTRYM